MKNSSVLKEIFLVFMLTDTLCNKIAFENFSDSGVREAEK
jgi:hypothetical protein